MGKRARSQDFVDSRPAYTLSVGGKPQLVDPGHRNSKGFYVGIWRSRSKYDPAECRRQGKR